MGGKINLLSRLKAQLTGPTTFKCLTRVVRRLLVTSMPRRKSLVLRLMVGFQKILDHSLT